MLLYLSSNQNIELFDFLMNEYSILVKRLVGEFYLKKFVIHDMRNFSHCSFVAIDLEAIKDTEDEIIEAIVGFRSMYDSRIIIFAEGRGQGDTLLSRLYDEGIYNFITAQTIEGIRKEILECVSTEGMSSETAYRYKLVPPEQTENEKQAFPARYHFNCEGLKIAVAGVGSRTGTTTTALNLAHYLSALGARVSYLEANKNGHIAMLPLFYKGISEKENYMEHKGVNYYTTRVKFEFSAFHFNILDIGVLGDEYFEIYKKCDIRILCATSKPYELVALTEKLKWLGDTDMNLIFSFTPDSSRDYVHRLIKGNNIRCYFSGYSPDLFDGNANKVIWEDIVNDYVVAELLPNEQKKRRIGLFK